MTQFFVPPKNVRAPELLIPGGKPLGPVEVDWTHKYAKGLVCCALFGTDGVQELTGRTDLGTANWSPDSRVSKIGVGAHWDGSSGTNYLTIPVTTETNAQASILWRGISHGTNGVLMRDATGSGGNIPIWQTASIFDVRWGGNNLPGGGTWSINESVTFGFSVGSKSGYEYWNSGTRITGASYSSGTEPVSPWYIHRNGTLSSGLDATTHFLCIWDIELTETGLKDLTVDPYQFLKPAGT